MREIDVQRLLCLERSKMDGAVLDYRAVNLEREQIPDHLKPGAAGAGLRFSFARRIDEIELRLFHQQAADDLAMEQRIPLNGEIHALRREERHRDVAGGFADANVVNGISAAPKVIWTWPMLPA